MSERCYLCIRVAQSLQEQALQRFFREMHIADVTPAEIRRWSAAERAQYEEARVRYDRKRAEEVTRARPSRFRMHVNPHPNCPCIFSIEPTLIFPSMLCFPRHFRAPLSGGSLSRQTSGHHSP